MSIESTLTRELDIRFIDARDLVNEAKMSLDIVGYPTKQQEKVLTKTAVDLFKSRPDRERQVLRRRSADLQAMKSGQLKRATSGSTESTADSECPSEMSSISGRKGDKENRGWLKRTFSAA